MMVASTEGKMSIVNFEMYFFSINGLPARFSDAGTLRRIEGSTATDRWQLAYLNACRACAPDAAQRHKRVYARLRRAMALRGVVRCRAGAVRNSGVRDGPGSAEQHEECRTASGTREPRSRLQLDFHEHDLGIGFVKHVVFDARFPEIGFSDPKLRLRALAVRRHDG